jgi:hypothetical protein
MDTKYHLAQINIALAKDEMDTELMSGFVSRLDEINAVADQADGFIWRLQTDEGDSTAIRIFDESLLLVNMSVWGSVASFKNFVYKSAHVELIRDRQAWFHKYVDAHQAMWWIPVGKTPTLEEAKEKLVYIQKYGATATAFHFGKVFDMPKN